MNTIEKIKPARLTIATTFASRLKGLLGTSPDENTSSSVLLIPHCRSVHTFGMGYGLDIAFANDRGVVLRSERNIRPNHLLFCHGASFVLERPYIADDSWFASGERIAIGAHQKGSENDDAFLQN